jgi:toxin CptA
MRSDANALALQPRPSACLLRWLVLLHSAAVAAICVADVGALVKALLAVGLGGSVVFSWRILYRGAARYRLVWQGAGDWSIQTKDGAAERCDTWEVAWIDPRIVVLRFRLGRRRRLTLALCADSLPPDAHRRLRARLLSDYSTKRGA